MTGIGVISPGGIGRQAFSQAIFGGRSAIKPISLFDTSAFKVKTAAEIDNFQPQQFLGPKGLRVLDRSAKLVNCAAYLALEDAHLEISGENSSSIGVSVGNTLGSIESICEFDRVILTEGAKYVNPSVFPNTVINSAASQISIRFNIKGFNATISTGFSASLDAINYAVNFIKLGRAKAALAGGVEELCLGTFAGFYKSGCLSGLKEGSAELSCPFDRRRNGIVLGEGSYILALEDLTSALSRKAHIYAEIKGYATSFGIAGLKTAMRLSLERANILAQDIDYISAGANSTPEADRMEALAIKEVFSQSLSCLRVSAVKSMIGECFSASGALQAAASICAIEEQSLFPTINYEEKDNECDLPLVVDRAGNYRIDNVLINSFGPDSSNSSMVISKFGG